MSAVGSIATGMLQSKVILAAGGKHLPPRIRDPNAGNLDRPATMRSVPAVASPARISLTNMSAVKPLAIRIASVQPSGDAASSSSARRRVAGGLRLRLCGGIGDEIPSSPCYPTAA
jgi:hypothetical protein